MSLELLEKRFAELQDRLNVLQDATNQLNELIRRLANFDFQPGSVPLGAADDDHVGAELGSEINQVLREQEEELELLHEEIVDLPPGRPGSTLPHDRERLKDGVERLGQELQLSRTSFRKAQMAARRNLQAAQRQERALLYASFSNPRSGASSPASSTAPTVAPRRQRPRPSEMSKEEQMLHASHDVTQSMRRTHDMMATELTKSDFAHNTLKESTEALAQLSENYSSLDTILTSSRALLGTLLKSQKSDTWYLQSAFYLLVGTIAWLIWRRLLWGPTWWLVWLPLKLSFKAVYGVSGAVGLRGSKLQSGSDSASLVNDLQQASMQYENVPTIEVGMPPAHTQALKEEGSMLEEVGNIIDEAQVDILNSAELGGELPDKEGTVLRQRTSGELPNPKKRMTEEKDTADAPAPDDQRIKDEL
ncbi:Sec20-domain-containing protein [Astrocystis sublimbata]|nr:Sec20-domain-containing protein [Astrocystis sublimbata]